MVLDHILVPDVKSLEQLASSLAVIVFSIPTTEMIGDPVVGVGQRKQGNTAEILAVSFVILVVLAVLLGDEVLAIMAEGFSFPATPFCRDNTE